MSIKKESKTIKAIAKRMLTGQPLNLTVEEKVAIRKFKFNQMPDFVRNDKAYQLKVAEEIQQIRIEGQQI